MRSHLIGRRGDGVSVWAERSVWRQRGPADHLGVVDAVLPVWHVGGAVHLHAGVVSTSARATGSGFASAIGRVGSLLGPLVTGLVFPITGQGGVFALGALCFAVAALVVWLFGMETKGKTLEELTQA